ncbi:MAG: DUF4832 domain-containing protein [Treponema sp.]|nr:DUF4832 domain-containing protein [Treponema sp.]
MKKKFNLIISILISIFVIAGSITIAGCARETPSETEETEETEENPYGQKLSSFTKNLTLEASGNAVVNPHKGFVQYIYGAQYLDNEYWDITLASGKNEAWDYCSVVYTTCGWNSIQKGKNEYDWSFIDDQIEACEKYNKTIGWRIYPVDGSSENGDLVPSYIYEEGCQYVNTAVTGATYTLRVPDWEDQIYIQACKDFAKEMASRYDGNKYVEFIDIRSFGNWGEWHCSQFEDSEMPSEEVQKDMLDYYASVFKKTQLVVPSDCSGTVYDYALSLGIAKRNDGLIQIKDREYDLYKCYQAGLPAIGENCDTYKNLFAQTDSDQWSQKWTLERWKNVINESHMTFYELDRDNDCGKSFYNDNAVYIKEMTNKLGYNFQITSADINYDDSEKLTVSLTIKNTGLAPVFFDVNLIAEVSEEDGSRKQIIGEAKLIEKATFKDGDEKTYSFTASGLKLCKEEKICLGLYEDSNSENPSVKFDNKKCLVNNKVQLLALTEVE